jgi:hypothetical protein
MVYCVEIVILIPSRTPVLWYKCSFSEHFFAQGLVSMQGDVMYYP